MPLIRIDVPQGVSTNIKKQIHSKVREVVLRTLAPKEVKYDYVSIREAFGFIGDGLPLLMLT
jgi:phenylpyruvate tautomerase PptA (4-oxalocrotonate tautomerase family)